MTSLHFAALAADHTIGGCNSASTLKTLPVVDHLDASASTPAPPTRADGDDCPEELRSAS